jgi:hypothetical protein
MRNSARLLALAALFTTAVLPAVPAAADEVACTWQATELPNNDPGSTNYVFDAAEGGWFAGSTDPSKDTHQVRWRNDGSMETLDPGQLRGINSAGVAISSRTAVYPNGTVRNLPAPPSIASGLYAVAITNTGDIIGYGWTSGGIAQSLLWPAGENNTVKVIEPPAGYDHLAAIDLDEQGWALFQARPTNGDTYDFLLRSPDGTFKDLDKPAPGDAQPFHLRGGKIVGVSQKGGNEPWATTEWDRDGKLLARYEGQNGWSAFVDSNGRIADSRYVGGKYQIGVWENGVLTVLGSEFESASPYAITDDGVIAAQVYSDGKSRPVAYRHICS